MKQDKKHLPVLGVGPIYVISILALTVLAVCLSKSALLQFGKAQEFKLPFIILGISLIIIGIILWTKAVFESKIDRNIMCNTLVTTGVYAYVRNPIYSAFLLLCTGVILCCSNFLLLLLPIIYWLFLTVLMKSTEEKWLKVLYNQQYIDYCKKVNRCIPWFRRKK